MYSKNNSTRVSYHEDAPPPTTEQPENGDMNFTAAETEGTMENPGDTQPLLMNNCHPGTSGWVSQNKYVDIIEVDHSPEESRKHKNGFINIDILEPQQNQFPKEKFPQEKLKTLIAFFILLANWILTTITLSIVHERLPDRKVVPPLPDIFFDLVPQVDNALDISEYLIVAAVWITIIVILSHKHRFIVLRRVFMIVALLYLMRSVTMFVTQVPVANTHYFCAPKANITNVVVITKRVLQLLSGFGLSMNGKHIFCGDYIYSGHTVMLTMAYLVIREYSPKRYFLLHIAIWILAVVGVILVLVSRGHYTVDVVVAYYVATRLFWVYHTMANNNNLKVSCPTNHLARQWWFGIFLYFEKNVDGVIPNDHEWPISFPRWFKLRRSNCD